jgi:hypothetical protein
MRHSGCEKISGEQVVRLEERRRALGLTRADLLQRFARALKDSGCVHSAEAAKMRLDRVFNPRMRRPMSESTKAALGMALGWKMDELDKAIGRHAHRGVHIEDSVIANLAADLKAAARTLHTDALKLESLIAKEHRR